MTDYGKLSLGLLASDFSDYYEPYLNSPAVNWELSPAECSFQRHTIVEGTPLSVDLSSYTTISAIVLRNRSITAGDNILLKYRTIRFSYTSSANQVAFADANPDTIESIGAVYNFAPAGCERFRAGDYVKVTEATEVANNGTFLIQNVSGSTITVANAVTLAFTNPEGNAVTLKALSLCSALVSPRGFTVISGNTDTTATYPLIDPSYTMVLSADNTGGTREIEVEMYVFGS